MALKYLIRRGRVSNLTDDVHNCFDNRSIDPVVGSFDDNKQPSNDTTKESLPQVQQAPANDPLEPSTEGADGDEALDRFTESAINLSPPGGPSPSNKNRVRLFF
jgi:hypothetical protein